MEDADAGLGELRALGADGVASATLRGESVELYGTVDAGAAAELWVDGSWVATVDTRAKSPALLTRVDGLQPGWHSVEVRAIVDGVRVDALAASSSGATFSIDARRGCATAPGAPPVVLWAGVAALALRAGRSRRSG